MADYFDVISFKKTKNDKVIAVRLGSAKKRDDQGFNMWLDAIPAPGPSGQYEIQVVPQREKKPAANTTGSFDDEVGF